MSCAVPFAHEEEIGMNAIFDGWDWLLNHQASKYPYFLDLGKVTCMLYKDRQTMNAIVYIHDARLFLQSLYAEILTMNWLPRN